jgi:hypothetical protein
MGKDAMDRRWMGGSEPDFQAGLTCDVEITNESSTVQEINAETAWALRELAAQIEGGKLESGSYPIKGRSGLEIGKVSLDYYTTGPR